MSRKKIGRPRLSAAELARRGTARRGRPRSTPKKNSSRHETSSQPRNFPAIADAYVSDVLEGRIIACRWTKLACERFRRMKTSTGWSFSPPHVQDVCSFIERLPHVEGKWSSATIVLEPWQVFILAAVYGFRRVDVANPNSTSTSRLVTTAFFEVARKSAKSTLVAACALYHLLKEDEPGAQVITAATTGSQARIVFSIMQRMVKRSLWLREQGLTVYANAITSKDGNAKPINSKSSSQDGLNPSFISLDESHAQNFGLHDVVKSAQGARGNPLLLAPTTAGYDLTSVGYALRGLTMKVLENVVAADHVFGVLYELDEGDAWQDEAVWPKALPMLGVTPTLAYVRQYRDEAMATPGMEGEFQVKVCNQWLHSASTWLPIAKWHACVDRTLTLDQFEHEPCWIGVDLAERDDICAVALCFRKGADIVVFVRGYLPALVVHERAKAVPSYRDWIRSGELQLTDGNLTDFGVVEADLRADTERFDVKEIVIEKFGALHLAANLGASGITVRLEQKNAKVCTPPAKELAARISAGQIKHTGSSFLTWQISNVCVERRRDGSLLPTKENPMSPNKIDAVDAILLALSGIIAAPTVDAAVPTIFFVEA